MIAEDWCGCQVEVDPLFWVYYEKLNGLHGYMCPKCHGVTQTG